MTKDLINARLHNSTTMADKNTLPLLVFLIDGQAYGIPVNQVLRIIEMVTITKIYNVAEFMEGLINFQGKAVPVVDMRQRLGFSKQAYGLHTPIILVDSSTSNNSPTGPARLLGLVVDEVEQVIYISTDDVEEVTDTLLSDITPMLRKNMAFLTGLVNVDRRIIIVLEATKVLRGEDYVELKAEKLLDKPPKPNHDFLEE